MTRSARSPTARGETLSQLALQWTLRDKAVTSALIGASRAEQITENVAALSLPPLTGEELAQIDAALALNEITLGNVGALPKPRQKPEVSEFPIMMYRFAIHLE